MDSKGFEGSGNVEERMGKGKLTCGHAARKAGGIADMVESID